MFRAPRYVLSRGRPTLLDGALTQTVPGSTLRVAPGSASEGRTEVLRWFREVGTFHADQRGPREEELVGSSVVGGDRG